MLNAIHVKNMAVIKEEEIRFCNGLNILTGETGAGKSILLGSVNLALGAKADKSLIRGGCEQAVAELEFQITDPAREQALKALDIYPEDGVVTLSRRVMPNRSVSRINGETVSTTVLSEAASLLIDIHGQQDNQILLKNRNHRELLDMYGGTALREIKKTVKKLYAEYIECGKKLAEASMDSAQRARTMDLLEHEIREIESASLREGEDENLEAEYHRLVNGQKIAESLSALNTYISSDRGAVDLVQSALREVQSVIRYDESLSGLYDQLSDAASILQDAEYTTSKYLEDFDYDPAHLDEIQERLDLINHLKSKYGNSISDILQYEEEKKKELEILNNYGEFLEKLEQDNKIAYDLLVKDCATLTSLRQEAAIDFCKEVILHMKELNFAAVQFEAARITDRGITAEGAEEIEFRVSLNPGEPIRPLAQAASGGELSRIMLAIKTVLSRKDEIPTLIFDEIDAGISGRTAAKVAEKLLEISENRQVICITHLPQIAAAADRHFIIDKHVEDGHSETHVKMADEKESTMELARMLGSDVVTDTTLQNAEELRNMSQRKVAL